MAGVTWVKIASWHVLRFDDTSATACGLEVGEEDEILERLPPDWYESKTCEICQRLKAKAGEEE